MAEVLATVTRTCQKCREVLPIDSFHRNKKRRDGIHVWCKSCRRVELRVYYAQNPDVHRRYILKTLYGITIEEYDRLFDAQGGGCAICGGTNSARRLSVDHDHETGQVRGLLCQLCNRALSHFREDPALFERAIVYLNDAKRGRP